MTRTSWVGAVVLLAVASACDGGAGGGGLAFEGRSELLPGFDVSTGWQPAGSPVQVQARASAAGGVTVRAGATSDGSTLTPTPSSGELGLEGQLTIVLLANIDTSGITYEGAVDELTYEVPVSSVTFDPFALDAPVPLRTDLPAQELGTVPIPSVPGATVTLAITGGHLDTAFQGTCAQASAGLAQYAGRLTMAGQVSLSATVLIEVPIVGDQRFGPFELDVPIPETQTPLDLGTRSLADSSAVPGPGPCAASVADGGPGGLDGGVPAMIDGDVGHSDAGVPGMIDGDVGHSDAGDADLPACSLCADACSGSCVLDPDLDCVVCTREGVPNPGASCVDSEDCGGALICLLDVCTELCVEDGGCTAGTTCAYAAVDPPGFCGAAECDPVDVDACGGTPCVALGLLADGTLATRCSFDTTTLAPGSTCLDTDLECSAGHVCPTADGVCVRLCYEDADCGAGGDCLESVPFGLGPDGRNIYACAP